MFGLTVFAAVSWPWNGRANAGPFVAVSDTESTSAGSSRICIWMGPRSSSVERDDRWQDTGCGRDDAGSECGASVNRSSRHGGKLRIVFEGACAQEWYRRAERSGHCEVGQEAAKERVEQGVGESERAGCGDHENEERGHGYGAQSRACCGHERGRCGNCRDASRRREG